MTTAKKKSEATTRKRNRGSLHAVVRHAEFMKHVKQEDPNGCGIACVAMLAGEQVTYQMVRYVWLSNCNGDVNRILAAGKGLRIFEVLDLGHLFGIKLFPYAAPIIVQINSKSGNGGHYVVITPDGTILDPSA
jgi:hypothetical protein